MSLHAGVLAAAAAASSAVHALVEERMAGGAPAPDAFRGLHLEPSDVEGLLSQPLLGARPTFTGGDEARIVLPPDIDPSPLGSARRALGLSAFETATIALCLLPELDARYGSLFGFLHDDLTRKQPSVELALTLCAPSGAQSLEQLATFAPQSRLATWRLLEAAQDEPLIRQGLQIERSFLWFLLGERGLHPHLAGVARLASARELAAIVTATPLIGAVSAALAAGTPVLLHGEDEDACLALAGAVATAADCPLLLIDGAAVTGGDEGEALLQQCLREGMLKGLLPCITGAQALLQHQHGRAEAYRAQILAAPAPSLLVCQEYGGETVAGGMGMVPIPVPPARADHRLARWREIAAARGIHMDEHAVLALSETPGLTAFALDEVAAIAEAAAHAAGETAETRHVQRAARSVLRRRAPTLNLTQPHSTWTDLVLPIDRLQLLRHLCSRVRFRSRVRETWGLGRTTLPGVTALFSGQPGTGKSMAADVIASDLGLDVCRIDLAEVVSKYIGETEKNLARIFDEAERSGAVLVFDEADALFGKRSDVKDSHDRYANIETSYLLQRMERYRGLALLTTNLRANLDEAFMRRIGVSVDFPMPAPPDRLRLWQRALAAAPCAPDLNLQQVAERLEMAGGGIVSAALTAAYLAAEDGTVVTAELLLRAVRWELQKSGRLLAQDALEALMPTAR